MIYDVQIRKLKETDSSYYFKWINDKSLVSFNSYFKPIQLEDHKNWMDSVLKEKRSATFTILVKKNGMESIIGSCSLRDIHQQYMSASLQIRIGEKKFRGIGIGEIALNQLLKYGFFKLNLNRIELEVFDDNIRALNLYNRLGFTKEGLKREAAKINNKYKDLIIMSLLKEEYVGRK